MKIFETIKRHPRTVAATTAVLIGAGAIEGLGWVRNPTYDVPAGACVSPVTASDTYVDRGANLLLQTQAGFFTTGVVAQGTLPKGAYGVEASFKAPNADAGAWGANASRMLKPDSAGNFVLKMAIGPGEVQFGVRTVAPEGSPLCDTPPEVTYIHQDATGYFNAPGKMPWPNASIVVINQF